jgi:hypothetical protein
MNVCDECFEEHDEWYREAEHVVQDKPYHKAMCEDCGSVYDLPSASWQEVQPQTYEDYVMQDAMDEGEPDV